MVHDLHLFHGDPDALVFADEPTPIHLGAISAPPWKILVADDEAEVHAVTRMVLDDYRFEGRPILFLGAYSGEETVETLRRHPDTAIVLLDVVMESRHAGLRVVRRIREELGNRFVRIILRTGQPGEAPEKDIITAYDINDYKEKTELTAQKLFTTITASLRSYNDLMMIERGREGLEKIIDISNRLFEIQSYPGFARCALTQMIDILRNGHATAGDIGIEGFAAGGPEGEVTVAAATPGFAAWMNRNFREIDSPLVFQRIEQAILSRKSRFSDNAFIGYYPTRNGDQNILYLSGLPELRKLDLYIVQVLSSNLAVAFDGICLNRELVETETEIVTTLGEVVETRSKETANHVRRVAEVSYLLALKAGLSETEARLIHRASPMHDIGKVGIPDHILLKNGPLTLQEREVIQTHVTIGHGILSNSHRDVMRAAAIIAQQHHERWDGQGYAQGLAGEEIHIYGRITALADVFDALSHRRVYKAGWDFSQVIQYIGAGAGVLFDPRLTDIFLRHIDEFIAINRRYSSDDRG